MEQETQTPTPDTGKAKKQDYKGLLIERAGRSALGFPQFHTVNLGESHAPKFKSSVTVDGATFESSKTFTRRKEAERDAARVSLEGIVEILKKKGVSLVQNDTVFCKSILHEYATKSRKEKPTYTSQESKGLIPMFITSVTFDGSTYIGTAGRSKRESEQIAARSVIESILGYDNGTAMAEVVKSKSRLYAAIHNGNSSYTTQSVALAGEVDIDTVAKTKETQSGMAKDKSPNVASVESSSPVQLANSLVVDTNLSETTKPKQEICLNTVLGGSGVSPTTLRQSDPTVANTAQQSDTINPRKRRKRGKRPRSKKARGDGPSLMIPEPAIQVVSVAQEAS